MTRQLYQETLNNINANDEYKAKLKRELVYTRKGETKRGATRLIPYAAASACFATAAIAVFVFASGTGSNEPEAAANVAAASGAPSSAVFATPQFGEVAAYAASPGDHAALLALPCGALSDTPEETDFPAVTEASLPVVTFAEQDGREYIDSVSGIDLVVSGEDIELVTYASKNYEIFYEDSRNWKTSSGDLTWSEYNLFLTEDRVGKKDPTQADIVAALERMQFSGNEMDEADIKKFLDRVYTQEISDIAASGGDVDGFIEEKLAEPIDFSRYQVEYSYEDHADKAAALEEMGIPVEVGYVVTIINPANPPVAPVTAKTVTVRPGEYVTWTFDVDTIRELIGKEKAESGLSGYSDEITMTVTNTGGQTRTQQWYIFFTDDGTIVVTDSAVEALTM